MILIGKRMKHKMLGVGAVVAQEGDFLVIEFPQKTSRFQVSEMTFASFLTAEDPDVQIAILKELEDVKEAERQKALEAALTKQKEEEAKREALLAKHTVSRKVSPEKAVVKQERIPGKRMTFYVFQGGTFNQESTGGYIWAPVSSKDGGMPHHWTRLLDVQPGDIIFHGYNAHVQAISVARDKCYECAQPTELRTEDLWEPEGRRVDCDYIVLDCPIKTANHKEDILRLCKVKYAPFDKDGNGNMGYLYELNRELAQIFLKGIVAANPHLAGVDYVADLLCEEIS